MSGSGETARVSQPDPGEGTGADRRSWLPIGIAGGLLAVVLGTIALAGGGEPAVECATDVEATSPLLAPDRFSEDERLETLASSVDAMEAPFGEVVAGVGYDYDQWLRLYGVGDGLLSFTKDNAPVTLLDDEDLEPRWALRPKTKRIAWDATEDRFVLLNLEGKGPIRVGSFALDAGEQKWCRALSFEHQDGEPVATTSLANGDLVLVLPAGEGLLLARLDGTDGGDEWSLVTDEIARADYLGVLDEDTVLAGGVEEHRLAQPDPAAEAGPVLATFDTGGDRQIGFTYEVAAGESLHVAGVYDGGALAVIASADGSRLVSLDATLRERWSVVPAGNAVESTLRGDVLLMRTRAVLTAYAASTGEQLWRRAIPVESTYFPYGFTLSQVPSLDETHVLMPTTTSLEVLDITTGKSTTHALPTDGVSTTYWPYQLAVTPDAIAVVTNTGGVVAERG